MSATVVALMIPYLTGQVVAFALTARTFPPGVILWLGYFALGAFVTLLTVALGWAVGKVFGSVFAAMTAVLTCVILIGLLDRWLGSIVVTGKPEVIVAPAALILRLALVVAFLATLIWIAPSGVVSARGLLAPALAMFLLLMTMSNTGIVVNRRPAGAHVSCTDGAMKLCAWPEHRKYMSLLKKIDVRAAVLPSSLRLPPLIDEVGIQPTRHVEVNGREVDMVDYYAPIFTIIEGSPWSVAGDVSNAILNTTFDFGNDATCEWASRSDADRSRLLALGAWLESYLAGGGSPDYHTDATPEIRQALSTGRAMANDGSLAHQFSWANQEVKYLRGRYCHR